MAPIAQSTERTSDVQYTIRKVQFVNLLSETQETDWIEYWELWRDAVCIMLCRSEAEARSYVQF